MIHKDDLDFYDTPFGKYYLPKRSERDIVCSAIKSGILFDYKVILEVQRLYKPGTLILDVGSNFGQMAVAFSRFCSNPSSLAVKSILCFEAEPFVSSVLKMNIEANNLQNCIEIFDSPVWEKDGEFVSFPEPDFVRFDSWGSYGVSPKTTSGRLLRTITIDSLDIQEPISVMKIDIQGSDLYAMKGAIKTINRNRMPIIFEYEQLFQDDFDITFEDYVNFVKSIGYKFAKVIENNYLVIPSES